ncbi:MAG: hypothetical protein IT229_10265 [Flavobacteriales bacterium]|nr:hypothetical protein [Flavobacteriales bacterium]
MNGLYSVRLVIAVVLSCCVFVACSTGKDLTTDTRSLQFSNRTEKLAFLARYLKRAPGLVDAEYAIWYQDNGHGGVPGPSDYDIRIIARVVPDSLDAWTEGLTQGSWTGTDLAWKDLMADTVAWRIASAAQLYRGPSKVLLVHDDEGIVLARYSSMPIELE